MVIRGILLFLNNQQISEGNINLLSDCRRKRVLAIYDEIYKKQVITSEFLLRYILKKYYRINTKEIEILEGKYGKPYIRGRYDYVKFNISHTNNAVLCMVSDDEIGVDIEKLLPVEYKKICRVFTSEEEKEVISNNSLEKFYEIFTQKEAFTKMLGLGLCKPFNTFNVLDNMQNVLKTIKIQDYIISISSKNIAQKKIFIDLVKEDEIRLYE